MRVYISFSGWSDGCVANRRKFAGGGREEISLVLDAVEVVLMGTSPFPLFSQMDRP